MTSRVRAAAFAGGALACAALSAAVAGAGEDAGVEGFGTLTSVVVTESPIERAARLGPKALERGVTVRRVPVSFVPPDALGAPHEAVGRRLAVPLPAGSYLTASSLKAPSSGGGARRGPPSGTTPVEVLVTGAGALASTRTGSGDRVDVVVSGDSAPGPTSGKTYVAASAVQLLGLREGRAETGLESERWIATLAVTRAQALKLIRAESAGAQLRLLGT